MAVQGFLIRFGLFLCRYFLFNFVYTFGYTPLQGVYPVENLENTARAKGMALSGVIVSIVGFINTYAGPIALQNIKNVSCLLQRSERRFGYS